MTKMLSTIAAVLLLASTAMAQQGTYRYVPGTTYTYLVEHKMDMMQDMMGQTGTVSVEATGSFLYTPDKVQDNGDIHFNVKMDKALILVESPQGSQSLGNELAGKEFGFTMKPNGEVLEPDSSINQFKGQDMQIVGQALRLFPKLDASQIKPGNTWQEERLDTTGDGEDKMYSKSVSKYTVLGNKTVKGHDCVEISMQTDTEVEGRMNANGMSLRVDGTNSMTGTMLYDAKNGVLIGMDGKTTGEQHITDPNGSSIKVDISSSGTQKVEFITQ
jgi:hypothetical protein